MEIRNKMRESQSTILDPAILLPAIGQSFVKLDPRLMIKNPVMFVVEIVAALTTIIFLRDIGTGGGASRLHLPDHPLAVGDRAVCQLRRGSGGRPRQGAGGDLAQGAHRDHRQAAGVAERGELAGGGRDAS